MGTYRKVRAHFLCRQLAYSLTNLGDPEAQWATPLFYHNYFNIAHRKVFVVDRALHKRLTLCALSLANHDYLINFHTRHIWFMLESIPQDEQLLLVEIFEAYYGNSQRV